MRSAPRSTWALVLAGGYALQAHQVVDRPSQDVDFATSAPRPMIEIVETLVHAYRRAGYSVEIIECVPRMARLRLIGSGLECEVDVLKDTPRFSLEDLADRLGAVTELDDRGFTFYGLDEQAIQELRALAVGWESDIRARLVSGEHGPVTAASEEWDAYLADH